MNQPAPDANHLLQFWLILSMTFSTLVSIGTLILMLSNRKQKREVSFTETPASKREFDQFTATTNANFVAVRNEMAEDRRQNQVHASERSRTLFGKMDDTRAELDAKLEETRRELSERIDSVPDRVIATLKNTGAI